jgi:hypothetical protein
VHTLFSIHAVVCVFFPSLTMRTAFILAVLVMAAPALAGRALLGEFVGIGGI